MDAQSGGFYRHYVEDDIPSISPIKLNTGSIGLLIPPLSSRYGGSQTCDLIFYPSADEEVQFSFNEDLHIEGKFIHEILCLNATTNNYDLAVNFTVELEMTGTIV